MIKKLFNFKSLQLNQQLIQKKQLVGKIFDIDEKTKETKFHLSTASVKPFGAIGDFKVLEIHKNSMRFELSKLEREKRFLQAEISGLDKIIMECQKELEQYGYILKQEQKAKIKKEEKNDELIAGEYMQSKWVEK